MPRALPMNQTGRELLAGSRLAGNVDRGLTARELLDHLAHGNNRCRTADELSARIARLSGALFAPNHLRQAERRFNQGTQLIQRNRFRQIIEGTGFQCSHGVIGTTESRNDGHGRRPVLGANQPHDLQPIAIRQAHVGQAQPVAFTLQESPGFGHRPRAISRQTHPRQRQIQKLADIGFVIDDQHTYRLVAPPPFRFPY